MGGLRHTAFDTIEDLRRNLRDRYKDCHSVLKELIQNADDAGATELHIVHLQSLPNAEHPLLQGPLLAILNNASFSFLDSYSIHLAGTGSKGHEDGKIGKFGLGLKSVFHLCEAFFYFSDPSGDADSAEPELKQFGRTGILNPWFGERYTDWDTFTEHDRALLRELAAEYLGNGTRDWFGLCLPLRKRSHCQMHAEDQPGQWAIEPKYYGDSDEPPEDVFIERRLAGIQPILPLMSTLQVVRFWHGGSDAAPRIVQREPRKHVDWRRMTRGRGALCGTVSVVDARSSNSSQLYAGVQELLDDETLSRLVLEEEWPHTDSQTASGRQRRPAVARQHAGAVVLEQSGSGYLSVDRAVFLPLGDPPHPECRSDSQYAFDLILHGYFFVDAGRLGVDFAPEGERPTVRQRWNRALYENGTLPLIIPALAEYALAIDEDTVQSAKLLALTDLLSKSRLWEEHREQICRDSSWLFRLNEEDGNWCEVPNAASIVYLPGDNGTDPQLPFVLFPALAAIAEQHVVSLHGLPRLVNADGAFWPDGFVSQLFQSVPVQDVVANDDALRYLHTVATDFHRRDAPELTESLLALMRSILRTVPLRDLRSRNDVLPALFRSLPENAVLVLPFKRDLVGESERLFEALVSTDTTILPVPDLFLESDDEIASVLQTADARTLLSAVSNHQSVGVQEDAFQSLLGQTTLAILRAWDQGDIQIRDVFGELRIFHARNYADERRTVLSFNELETIHATGLLFCKSASFCKRLQACAEHGTVVFLSHHDIASFLSGAIGTIPACDATACVKALADGIPLVAEPAPRAELLRGLLPSLIDGVSSPVRQALRYLLHRSRERIADNSMLLVEKRDAWSALAACILRASDNRWRLLFESLAVDLAPSHTTLLGIGECNSATVPALIRDSSGEVVDCSSLMDRSDWIEQIIREWPESELGLLRALPLFRRTDGSATTLTSETFIQGDLPPPPESVFPNLVLVEDPTGAIGARSLAPSLAPVDVVRTALELDDCHIHWQFILESIPSDLSEDIRRDLRTRRWLPGLDGNAFAPQEIICRDNIAPSIRALRAAGRHIIAKADLDPAITRHARWSLILEPLCPRGEELYRRLGTALRDLPQFAVGDGTVDEQSLDAFLEVFDNSTDVMPAAALFNQLRDGGTGGVQWIARHLLPAVQNSLPLDRVHNVLSHIGSRHETSSSARRRQYLDLFNAVLDDAIRTHALGDVLRPLRLLNRDGRWCDVAALALSGTNVADSHLVHSSHARILSPVVSASGGTLGDSDGSRERAIAGRAFDSQALAASASFLGDYLDSWRAEDVPDDAIAAVVAMLGDNDGYPSLYDSLRDTRELGTLRSMFEWRPAGPGWQLQDLMEKQHFCVVPADATTVTATNLLGQTFDAAVSGKLVSLFDGFDGREYYSLPNDHRCYVIRLRQIDPEGLTTEQKLEILGCTVHAIRSSIHRQSSEDFQAVWSKVTQVGQLDIEIAQDLILESSAMLLETQLSVRHAVALCEVFNAWHRVRQRLQTSTTDQERHAANAERLRVLEQLRSLLVDDPDTQKLLLTEICKRLDAASYDCASIPFELFQNADDAVVELESLCDDASLLERARPADLRCRFIVEETSVDGQSVLRFIHWGRGINQFRVGTSDGRDRGFDRDMERMLVLQGSGKDDADDDDSRTGKFGLGFKSVFFVSDSPRVLSGTRSRFCVLGGVYPNHLKDTEEQRLEVVLDDYGDPRHKGTVIELPLRGDSEPASVLERFRSLAGLSVVFARRLRNCTIGHGTDADVTCDWSPRQITESLELGEVRLDGGATTPLLVFRLTSDGYGAVAFAIGSGGVCAESLTSLPEVWVTTPTNDRSAGGVLVNGDFDVNPGRTQLRSTDNNRRLALALGQELGRHLCKLFRSCVEDWATMQSILGCTEATHDEFWTSLWHTCAPYAGEQADHAVTQRILFGSEHCGILRLISNSDALPSGLRGKYGCLTSLSSVAWATKGILDEEEVWLSASTGRWIRDAVQPGAVVAASVGTVLDRVCDESVPSLTLAVVLEHTLTEAPFVSPDIAQDLGQFLTADRLRTMAANRSWTREEERIRELLSTLKFKSEAEGWSPAAELLLSSAPATRGEERHRAAFAPPENRLSPDYDAHAVQFFLACRKEMQATAEQMSQWLLDATDIDRRRAGLEYLERGELSHHLQECLQARSADVDRSWLGDPEARNEAMPVDPNRQAVVMGKLSRSQEFIEERTQHLGQAPEVPKSSRPPGEVLNDIVKWWRSDRDHILACHDRRFYPGGQPPNIEFSVTADQLASDVTIRREWMILFMRGATHRFGRVTDQQNRDFLRLCDDRGWLDILSGPADSPSDWFGVMDEYLDSLQGEARYFQWMNQFLAFYQLARWLPAYARAFEAVTRPGVSLDTLFDIGDIANLRTSHVFAGSTGFDAPPCSRTLGMGAHFVLREALRARRRHESDVYAVSPALVQIAYVPTLRVRRLLSGITGRTQLLDDRTPREVHSKQIAKLLSEHLGNDSTFDGYFDIPLLALMWNDFRSTRDQLLGEESPFLDDELDDLSDAPPAEEGGD